MQYYLHLQRDPCTDEKEEKFLPFHALLKQQNQKAMCFRRGFKTYLQILDIRRDAFLLSMRNMLLATKLVSPSQCDVEEVSGRHCAGWVHNDFMFLAV